MNFPRLPISDIQDYNIRKCFELLRDWLKGNSPLSGFTFFEVTISSTVTNYLYPHNLGYQPKDIITSSIIGGGDVTFNYSDFDRTNLSITTSGPCVVRFFAGTYGGVA